MSSVHHSVKVWLAVSAGAVLFALVVLAVALYGGGSAGGGGNGGGFGY